MIVQLLSLLDILSAITIVSFELFSVPWIIGLYVSSYLVLKAIVFSQTMVSWIDGLAGLWVLLLVFGVSSPFSYVVAGWLVFKAVNGLF